MGKADLAKDSADDLAAVGLDQYLIAERRDAGNFQRDQAIGFSLGVLVDSVAEILRRLEPDAGAFGCVPDGSALGGAARHEAIHAEMGLVEGEDVLVAESLEGASVPLTSGIDTPTQGAQGFGAGLIEPGSDGDSVGGGPEFGAGTLVIEGESACGVLETAQAGRSELALGARWNRVYGREVEEQFAVAADGHRHALAGGGGLAARGGDGDGGRRFLDGIGELGQGGATASATRRGRCLDITVPGYGRRRATG